MSLDIAPALRDAVIDGPVAALLGEYKGEPSVHTRRPPPEGAGYPLVLINPDSAIGDMDGLRSKRPIVFRDIAVYGLQPDHYRAVEEAGYLLREQFHDNKFSIVPDGYSVIDIRARGPVPAPVDDEKQVGRLVSLTIRLRRNT